MFLLLLFGAVCGVMQDPAVAQALSAVRLQFRPAELCGWRRSAGTTCGSARCSSPFRSMPLTLGNAVIAVREEKQPTVP